MAETTTVEIDDKVLKELIKIIGKEEVDSWVIFDGVHYGVFQEFTARGHPSLRPAFERVTKQLPKAIGQAVEKRIPLNPIIAKAAFDIQAQWASDVNVDTGAYRNSITATKQ